VSPRRARRPGLAGELTILTAADQTRALVSLLTAGSHLEVDLSGVTDLDTAGVQVLLLGRAEAARQGSTLTYRDASRAVRDVLEIAHLEAVLLDEPAEA
jgi:anti-anti-sigma regulatory factor